MKRPQSIFYALIAMLLLSCGGNTDKADGYGNFEATETTVSSEANGKILFLSVEEGDMVQPQAVVGVIDTIQLSLQREQLLATKNTIFSKSRNVLSQREILKEQLKLAQTDLNRIENLIGEGAATQQQLDDVSGQVKILRERIKSVETQNAPIINEVKGVEVQLRQIEDQIQKSIIKNPLKGTVLVKYAEP
jgi:HlyD family secretion protein